MFFSETVNEGLYCTNIPWIKSSPEPVIESTGQYHPHEPVMEHLMEKYFSSFCIGTYVGAVKLYGVIEHGNTCCSHVLCPFYLQRKVKCTCELHSLLTSHGCLTA